MTRLSRAFAKRRAGTGWATAEESRAVAACARHQRAFERSDVAFFAVSTDFRALAATESRHSDLTVTEHTISLPVLSTARLLLRPCAQDDIDALHTLWTAPEVRRCLWDDVVITRETAQDAVESHLETAARLNIGYWALEIPNEAVAGFCGFRPIDHGPQIELMYGLRGEYWGQGLATEACAAALEYLWRSTTFERVFARTDAMNQRSVNVMRRLGMTHVETTAAMITYVLERPATASP